MVNKVVNITANYQELKDFLNYTLNKDKSTYKTSNDEPTPIECIEEMLGHLPEDIWSRDNLRILDPCSGNGNFHLVAFDKLRGHKSTRDILENILYFNEPNEKRRENIRQIYLGDQYELNITDMDFIKYNEDVLYDLQIVNPPYAKFMEIRKKNSDGVDIITYKRASKNHTLVRDFIQKSLCICKDGGYIVYIVPNNWMSLADRNTLIKELTQYKFHHLDIGTSKKFFPKIGSSFTYFVLEKTKFEEGHMFTVNCLYKKNTFTTKVKSQKRDFIPLCYNNFVQSILDKVLSGEKKFNIKTSSDLHKYTKAYYIEKTKGKTKHIYTYCAICNKDIRLKSEVSKHKKRHKNKKNSYRQCSLCNKVLCTKKSINEHKEIHPDEQPDMYLKKIENIDNFMEIKSEELNFKHKLIHTDKQTVYASRPHKFQKGWKVFISTTGSWETFVDNCGMTQSIAFINCKNEKDSEKNANQIKKILEHPLYKFVNNICRWGNFNCIRILQRMSFPDDPKNIYNSFNITDDERKFIEKFD